jgi:hypothetical protein
MGFQKEKRIEVQKAKTRQEESSLSIYFYPTVS